MNFGRMTPLASSSSPPTAAASTVAVGTSATKCAVGRGFSFGVAGAGVATATSSVYGSVTTCIGAVRASCNNGNIGAIAATTMANGAIVKTSTAAPAELQRRLRGCQTAEDTLRIAAEEAHRFDAVHATTCLFTLARLAPTAEHLGSDAFRRLLDAQRRHVGGIVAASAFSLDFRGEGCRRDSRQRTSSRRGGEVQILMNTAWSCAVLVVDDEQLIRDTFEATTSRLHELRARDLGNVTWSLAALRAFEHKTVAETAAEALTTATGVLTSQLSNSLWAIATLPCRTPSLVEGLAHAALTRVPECRPHDVAGLVWSLATLRVEGRGSVDVVSQTVDDAATITAVDTAQAALVAVLPQAVVERLPDLSDRHLANTAWGFAAMRVHDGPFFSAIVGEASARLGTLKSRELVSTMWSLAAVRAAEPGAQLVSKLISTSPRLNGFKTQDLANLAWAFASLEVEDSGSGNAWCEAIARVAETRLPECNPQELANLAWSFAKMASSRGHHLVAAVGQQLSGRALREFGQQELANTVWAFATMALTEAAPLDAFARLAREQLPGFKAQGVAITAWSLYGLGALEGDQELIRGVAGAAAPLLPEFTPQGLGMLAGVLAASTLRQTSAIRLQ